MSSAQIVESPCSRARAEGRRNHRGDDANGSNYSSAQAPIESLLNRLEGVRQIKGSQWLARCPAHDDESPSLSIRETDERTVLLHCFAGCASGEVLSALGLEFTDLFPDGPVSHHVQGRKRPRQSPRNTLAAVSHALTVVSFADSKLEQGEPLDDDERDAVSRAVKVLARFQEEGRLWH